MKRADLIQEIFSKQYIFEKKVLNIKTKQDKSDVLHILSHNLVHNLLKEHLSFLHINSISDFTLNQVVNILFKELASEWVHFAMDVLELTKDDALEELQDRKKLKFIHSLAEDYYNNYGDYFYEEIANSFIDLLASINSTSKKVILVNAIINSDLIANRTILNINSFDQLQRRIIAAKNTKNIELSELQMKLSDIQTELVSADTTIEKKERLLTVLPKYKLKNKKLVKKRLEHFDSSLQRVKMAIFNSLKNKLFQQ